MPIITMIVISLLVSVASFLIAELVRPKPDIENARPADSGDFRVTTATEGRKIPLIWGTVLMDGPNVVWWGNISTDPIRQKIKTGLFSSKRITVGFKYYVSMQMALCRGNIDGVRKIRYGKKLTIYDAGLTAGDITFSDSGVFGGDSAPGANGGAIFRFVQYTGAQSTADPHLSALLDTTLLPSYAGTAYLVFRNIDLASTRGGYLGDAPNFKMFDFTISRYPNNLSLPAGTHIVNTLDSNPMEVIYEILTDTDWGLGLPPSNINVANFQAAASTLHSEGNGFSFRLDTASEPLDILREVERQIAGKIYVDLFTGQFNIKLIRNDYVIGSLPLYDESNVVQVKSFARSSWNDTVNEVRIPFTDSSKDYRDTSALAQDGANFEIQGERKIATIRFPGVKNKSLAADLAWRELRTLSYPLAQISFVANRTAYDLIPGAVIRFSWEEFGITNLPLRVTRVDFGKLEDGRIIVDAVQDVFQVETSAFTPPPESEFVTPVQEVSPFTSDDQFISELPLLFAKQAPEGDSLEWRALVAAADAGGFPFKYEMIYGDNPSPSYSSLGDSSDGVARVGALDAALAGFTSALPTQGTGSFVVNARTGETLQDLAIGEMPEDEINAIFQGVAVIDPGTTDEEYIIYQEIAVSGTSGAVELRQVVRGALDTVPKAHSLGAPVWFCGEGGFEILPREFEADDDISVKLLGASPTDQVTEMEQSADLDIVFPAANKWRSAKPYAPNELQINGATRPVTVDVDTDISEGSEPETLGLSLSWTRRDLNGDKVLENALGLDDTGLLTWSNNEGVNSLQRWKVWLYDLETTPSPVDRGDAVLELDSEVGDLVSGLRITRDQIIEATTGNIVPNSMRVELETRANRPATDNESFVALVFDFAATSDLQTAEALGSIPYDTARPTGMVDIDVSSLTGNLDIYLQRHIDTQGSAHTQTPEFEVLLDGVATPITALSASVGSRPGITSLGQVSLTGVDQLQVRHAHGRGETIVVRLENAGDVIAHGLLAAETTQVGEEGPPVSNAHDFGWVEYDASAVLKNQLVGGSPPSNAWTVPRDISAHIHTPGLTLSLTDAQSTSENAGEELGVYMRVDRATGGTQVFKLPLYTGSSNDDVQLPATDITLPSQIIETLKEGDVVSFAANVARGNSTTAANPIQLYIEDDDTGDVLASGQFSVGGEADYASFVTSSNVVEANQGTTGPPSTSGDGVALSATTGQRLRQRLVARLDGAISTAGHELWLRLNSEWVELEDMPAAAAELALRASDTDNIRVWHNWKDGFPRHHTTAVGGDVESGAADLSLYDWAMEVDGQGNGDRAKLFEVPLSRTDGSGDLVRHGSSGTLSFSTDTPGSNSSDSIELSGSRFFSCGKTLSDLLPASPTEMSFGVWFKNLAMSPSKAPIWGAADGASWSEGFGMDLVSTTEVRAWVGDWTASETSGSGLIRRSFTAGDWNLLVYTVDLANDRATLYINGSQAGSQITDFTDISVLTGLDSLIQLGEIGGIDNSKHGRFDEAFIYDVELSAMDVSDIYNSGDPLDLTGMGAPSGLVGYWQIEDSPDTTDLLTDSA